MLGDPALLRPEGGSILEGEGKRHHVNLLPCVDYFLGRSSTGKPFHLCQVVQLPPVPLRHTRDGLPVEEK